MMFVIGGVVFVFKLLMGVGNHGVDGMKDSWQRQKEGKPEIRMWNEAGVREENAETAMRFCPYCGAKRTTNVCGSCGKA